MAAIQYRGLHAVTNFGLNRYIERLRPQNCSNNHPSITNDNVGRTTTVPPHPGGGTAEPSPEPEFPRRSFPDDIQTSFDIQDSSTSVEVHGIIFGDYDSFASQMLEYDQLEP